ncbi:peptidoglycan-binding domain-containing protein [Agromyces sp. ZXT2-3]|uniref:peptidoglycan-binding domain-containing protein n=1 Tax=Agromyces sp. ZXT2-3 TaxID=3461152 RepID=UPI004054FA8D
MSERGASQVAGWLKWLLAGGLLVVPCLLAAWAGAAVLAPPRDVPAPADFTYVALSNGEVGSSITLNAVAMWEKVPAGANRAAGVVTGVNVAPGDVVSPGSVLFELDLRPVVVAEGAVPAFRMLAQGAEGADVAQLQRLLAELGFYGGEQDGGFGTATAGAVRDWQESLGVENDGIVQPGDIVFVPSLPNRVALDPAQVFRGATLAGGELVVSVLGSEPSFRIPATTQQAAMMPLGTRVEIMIEDQVWMASVAGQKVASESSDQIDVFLTGEDDGSICDTQCELVPIEGESLLLTRIITQQTVSGLVAPSAALLTDADGSVSVIDDAGVSHPVDVIASSQGMSVIDGATTGMRVRVPASAQGAG